MNIPEGCKLVPVEPTVAMEDAAAPECRGYCPRCDDDMQIKTGMQVDVYRAMLAASPTPPQPIYDEVKERQLFEDSMIEDSEEAGFGEPDLYRDSGGCYRQEYHQAAWGGWLACAQSRDKAGEAGHE